MFLKYTKIRYTYITVNVYGICNVYVNIFFQFLYRYKFFKYMNRQFACY